MEFESTMEHVARVFEVAGVIVIIFGALLAVMKGVKEFRDVDALFRDVRRSFGQPLILGLEILVAADIIDTITVSPSLTNVGVLGILVAVRIALSFSLDVEVEGFVPWRRYEMETRSNQGD